MAELEEAYKASGEQGNTYQLIVAGRSLTISFDRMIQVHTIKILICKYHIHSTHNHQHTCTRARAHMHARAHTQTHAHGLSLPLAHFLSHTDQ